MGFDPYWAKDPKIAYKTINATVPAVVGIGLATGQLVVLGIDNARTVLLATTLVLSVITFCGPRTDGA